VIDNQLVQVANADPFSICSFSLVLSLVEGRGKGEGEKENW
jgi:hypothetical protein